LVSGLSGPAHGHTITGAIIGVGAARKVSAVRWNVASNVVFAWIVTLRQLRWSAPVSTNLGG
jgi:phosphate/sulfate permease